LAAAITISGMISSCQSNIGSYSMNASCRIAAILLSVGALLFPAVTVAATPTAKTPAASRYYPFLGHWKGNGQVAEAGKAPVPLTINVSCFKAASGWAVRCAMVAKSEKITMTEADLFGVDAVTGKGHWYALTNQGEASDLMTEWTDAKTMKAHRAWEQNGTHMVEKVTFMLPRSGAMEFRSVVTADGKEVTVFSGKLAR
jgi:hypothetical protein